jgi:ribosomal protein S18
MGENKNLKKNFFPSKKEKENINNLLSKLLKYRKRDQYFGEMVSERGEIEEMRETG